MLVIVFFFMVCSAYYLQHPGPPAQVCDIGHNGLDPETSITDKSALQGCLELNLMEAFSRLRFPPLR